MRDGFVGPSAEILELTGNKARAIAAATSGVVPKEGVVAAATAAACCC